MMKEEMTKIISVTAKITEIDADLIRSGSRQADIVDARCIAIKILHNMGYSIAKIAHFFHKTEVSVRNSLSGFDDRATNNKLFIRIYKEIENNIVTNS